MKGSLRQEFEYECWHFSFSKIFNTVMKKKGRVKNKEWDPRPKIKALGNYDKTKVNNEGTNESEGWRCINFTQKSNIWLDFEETCKKDFLSTLWHFKFERPRLDQTLLILYYGLSRVYFFSNIVFFSSNINTSLPFDPLSTESNPTMPTTFCFHNYI